MHALWLVIIASVLTGELLANDDQALQVQLDTEGDEDILRVTNSHGKVVAEVAVFENEGFQVVKPVASDKCYILKVCKTEECDEHLCYKGKPFNQGDEPPAVAVECENRQLYQLVASNECTHVAQLRDSGIKRKTGCIDEKVPVNVCAENETYCVARYGWGRGRRCKKYSTRCKKYDIRYRIAKIC